MLFESVLGDPTVQEFGSSGQPQSGIDLLGRRKSISLDHWVGIQCKLKIKAEKLPKKTVREEAEKALLFEPALKELIIVTTASDDAVLHKEAAAFTDEQAKAGRDFLVQVWGWGTLETYILQHEAVINAFSPDAFPHLQRFLHGQEALTEQVSRDHATLEDKFSRIEQKLDLALAIPPSTEMDGSSHDTWLDKQIDQHRDLIEEGNSAVALRLLQTMWDELSADASDRIRFRIKANIAACRSRFGEQEEAGHLYLEAYNWAPDEPKAAAFKVLGLTLLGRPQEAYDFGLSKFDSVDDKAPLVGHTLMAARLLPDQQDVLTVVPDEVQDEAFVSIAKIDYLRTCGTPEQWHELAKLAHAKHPDDKTLARFHAEASIDRVCRWSDEHRRALLTAELETDVRVAIETLSEQFDETLAKLDAPRSFDVALCSNLATAHRLLRDFDKARETIAKGLAIVPDDEGLLQYLALIALEEGTPDEAAALLDRVPESRDKIFGQLQIFATSGKWREVLALSGKTEISQYSEDDQAFFESIVLLARCRLDEISDVRTDVDALLAKFDAEPIVPILLYEIATSRQDSDWSAALYQAARDRQDNLSFAARIMLARVAENENDPDTVIDLLYGQIPMRHDSEELQCLARAFVNAPPRQDALAFVGQLSEQLKQKAFYARAIGSIDFNRGDLPSAQAAFKQAIESNQTALVSHLGLINTLLRLDRRSEVEEYLHSLDFSILQGRASHKMQLAQLLVHFGRAEDGLAYGYEVAQQNRNDGRVCLLYVGLILPDPANLRIPDIGETISVDCTVEIERSDKIRRKLTIEAGPNRPGTERFNPAHPFARSLIGAKVGDIVVYKAGGGTPQSWKVIGFKHKYIGLLHDIMETFPTHFPDVGGFQVIELPNGDVKPILEKVKAQTETDDKIFKLHIEDGFPICVIAALMGRSTIAIAGQFAFRNAVIKTCVGAHSEREAAVAQISDGQQNGVVLDTYTAWCVYSANLIDMLKSIFSRVVLPRSVLDQLRIWRSEYEISGDRPLMTIGYHDGEFFRDHVSPEDLRKSAAAIDEAIETLDRECEVLPCSAPASPSQLERGIVDIAGSESLDPIYLAASEDLLLLSEDLHYRNVARQLYQRDGVWLQAVLLVAFSKGVIDGTVYARSVVDLAARKHHYVTVESTVLLTIVEQDEDEKLPMLSATLAFIGNVTAEVPSHTKVGLEFLLRIWRAERGLTSRKERASGMMLDRLTSMWARHGDVTVFLRKLLDQTRHRPHLQDYIRKWARGHFIVLDKPDAVSQPPRKGNKKNRRLKRSTSKQ